MYFPEHKNEDSLEPISQLINESAWRKSKEDLVHYTLLIYLLPIVTSNLFILFIYTQVKLLQTPSNSTMATLAVADLLMGALGIPITVAFHFYRKFFLTSYLLCFISGPLPLFLFNITVSMLMLLTIDRCVAIRKPFWYVAHMTITKIMLSSACLVSIDMFIAGTYQYQIVTSSTKLNDSCTCDPNVHPSWIPIMYTIVAVTKIITSCVCTMYVVIRALRSIKAQQKVARRFTNENENLKSDAKVTASLTFFFAILFIPTIVVSRAAHTEDAHYYYGLASHFVFLNSSLNGVVYAFSMKTYKVAFGFLLTNRPCEWGQVSGAVRALRYRSTMGSRLDKRQQPRGLIYDLIIRSEDSIQRFKDLSIAYAVDPGDEASVKVSSLLSLRSNNPETSSIQEDTEFPSSGRINVDGLDDDPQEV